MSRPRDTTFANLELFRVQEPGAKFVRVAVNRIWNWSAGSRRINRATTVRMVRPLCNEHKIDYRAGSQTRMRWNLDLRCPGAIGKV